MGKTWITEILRYFERSCDSLIFCRTKAKNDPFDEDMKPPQPSDLESWLAEDTLLGDFYRSEDASEFQKVMVLWLVEGERLFREYQTELTVQCRSLQTATYRETEWADTVPNFYAYFFLEYLIFLYENLPLASDDTTFFTWKSDLLKDVVVDGFLKLQSCGANTDIVRSVVMDSISSLIPLFECPPRTYITRYLQEEIKRVDLNRGRLLSEFGEEGYLNVENSLAQSHPLADLIRDFLNKKEIRGIYTRICSCSESDYTNCLETALNSTFILPLRFRTNALTLSCKKIIIKEICNSNTNRKHPGVILGSTLLCFVHEFCHYLLRNRATSIKDFYDIQSPSFDAPIIQIPAPLTGSRTQTIVPSAPAHSSGEELSLFLEEAQRLAYIRDNERTDFDLESYYAQLEKRRKLLYEQPVDNPLWINREVAREVVALCPVRTGGEGGNVAEMEIAGGLFKGMTLAAAKAMISACVQRTVIDIPRLHREIAAGMQTPHVEREMTVLNMFRGASRLVEDRETVNLCLWCHGTHFRDD